MVRPSPVCAPVEWSTCTMSDDTIHGERTAYSKQLYLVRRQATVALTNNQKVGLTVKKRSNVLYVHRLNNIAQTATKVAKTCRDSRTLKR